MEVFFHLSWRRSYSHATYCDQSVIESGDLIGAGGRLNCEAGCSGSISDVQYTCTDFSVDEDWSFGERLVTHNFTGGPDMTIAFTGGDWISPFNSNWRVSTSFSLIRRNDTGEINSTPRAITSPVLRLQEGCNHTITIPVTDPDGDIVRCRWAVGSECAGICGGFPGAELDPETCSLAYFANQGQGHRAAAIMIEDFLPGSDIPMSSVGLQFLVLVVNTMSSCSVTPTFVNPTPQDGSCVAIPSGQSLNLRLVADSGYEGDSISEIQTVSPLGLMKSSLISGSQPRISYVNITWSLTPQQEDTTHLFCFTASNFAGLSTSQSCIQLLPGHSPPSPVQDSAMPNMALVYPYKPMFQIDFDMPVERPSISALITFHEFDTGRVTYEINVLSQVEVEFANASRIILTPNYMFEEKTAYYINLERGVVVGLEGCGPGNEPVTDTDFWTFTTQDITPPTISTVNGPSVSNGTVFVFWTSNEPVTWICSLNIGHTSFEVNCSDATWGGYNLGEGSYRLEITAADLANNTATVIHTFRVDITPPAVEFTSVPGEVSNSHRVSILFRCESKEICTYICTFYKGEVLVIDQSSCLESFLTPFLIGMDTYRLEVVPTDQAGNKGEVASYSWETDFEAPTVFGVANISSLCTGDLSPHQTGQAKARDNSDPSPMISFHDRRITCSLVRTWRAIDVAGNLGTLTQYITLQYVPALNFISEVSLSCDSSTDSVIVPTNTATLANPCRRPLRLSYEDTSTNHTCPQIFTRTWRATDDCTQEVSFFEQRISLFDVCPLSACGRNETPPHGICIQGSCVCKRPWFGEQCDILIHSINLQPVDSLVLEELEDYFEQLVVVNGTPPLQFSLLSGPDRMVLSEELRTVSWSRAQVGNYTITVQAQNEVSSKLLTWSLIVKPGYTAVLDPVTESLYSRATSIEMTGHVEFFEDNIVQDLLQGFVPITVEIYSRNGRRELKTFSHRDGTFSVLFLPAPTEYGSYVAGAKHPHSQRSTEQTSWNILGMSATPRYVQLRDSTVAAFKTTFRNVSFLTNDGPLALHNITVVALIESTEELRILPTITDNSLVLEPGDIAYIDIQVISAGPLQASFPVRLASVEGAETYFFVNLYITQILPELVVSPSSLTTRVARGTARSLDFIVTNVGIIEAHMVRAILPNAKFLSLVTFGTARQQNEGQLTLESRESAILTVLVSIPAEEPLGEISGRIVVSSMPFISESSYPQTLS